MIITRRSLLCAKLTEIVSADRIVLFMKGTSTFPLCGLSAHVCFWMKKHNLSFKSVDVLQDPELHIFLRELHAPRSMPYLYANGKFIGGYDEIEQIFANNELEFALAS